MTNKIQLGYGRKESCSRYGVQKYMKIKETSDGIILEDFVKTGAKKCKIETTDEVVIFHSKKRPHKGI